MWRLIFIPCFVRYLVTKLLYLFPQSAIVASTDIYLVSFVTFAVVCACACARACVCVRVRVRARVRVHVHARACACAWACACFCVCVHFCVANDCGREELLKVLNYSFWKKFIFTTLPLRNQLSMPIFANILFCDFSSGINLMQPHIKLISYFKLGNQLGACSADFLSYRLQCVLL